MKSLLISLAIAGLPLAAAASPAAPSAPTQASIPFVNHGGIRDWQAVDRDTLYVQDQSRHWYKAELFAPCFDLPFAQAIGFETRGIDTFDRFSTVRVGRDRCAVQSLTRSDPPPAKARTKHG